MEFDRKAEFERLMEEIVPMSIPSDFVKELLVTLNNGQEVTLTGEELLQPLPVANDLSWDKLINQFDKIEDIQVKIDVPAIQESVVLNVMKILAEHFQEIKK
jgi:hypothetical protein